MKGSPSDTSVLMSWLNSGPQSWHFRKTHDHLEKPCYSIEINIMESAAREALLWSSSLCRQTKYEYDYTVTSKV